MTKKYWIGLGVALALTAFIVACRIWQPLADFYALHLYPGISGALSWISSPVHFSVQGVAIVVLIGIGVAYIIRAARKKISWGGCLMRELKLLLWVFVWFYMAWCLNYSRSSLFARTGTELAQFDSTAFVEFLDGFAEQVNEAYVVEREVDPEVIEREIKEFYASVPARYGLARPRAWQHPKRMMPEAYHTATGILGYEGPLFAESHLNSKLLPVQVPFTWAHEYSHLMGVSSEAEANWWAWHACMSSAVAGMRYSACLSMLSYVLGNASRLLPEEGYDEFVASIRLEVLEDLAYDREYWRGMRNPTLDKIQGTIYDMFLKSNNISSGTLNYSEVVQMMMSVEYR